MKFLALILLSGIHLFSQTLTITGPSSITAGNNAPIVISLAGSSGLNISGLQWSLPTSTGVSYGLPVLSSASNTAGKGIWCNAANSLCLVALSSGTAYTILVLSRCDVNGDGVVNNADVQAMIAALTGKGSCPTSAGCTLQTTIEVIIAALGGACQL